MFDNQKRKIEVRSDDGFFRVFTDGDCVIEIDSTKHAAQVSNFETIATEFFIFCDRAYRKAASYRKPKKRRKVKYCGCRTARERAARGEVAKNKERIHDDRRRG